MLKKPSSFVLAPFRPSTYRKGTPRVFTRCGLAGSLFEHPARAEADSADKNVMANGWNKKRIS
jgi:hypothetical protein